LRFLSVSVLLLAFLADPRFLPAQLKAPQPNVQQRSALANLKKAARAHEAARRLREAEAAYKAYLQGVPGDIEARSSLGRLYSWDKDYEKALEQFRLVLSSKPSYAPALVGMARVLAWQGKYEESLRIFDRVVRTDPQNGEAAAGRAYALLWMGRPEEAQRVFAQLHHRYPQDQEITQGLSAAQDAIKKKSAIAQPGPSSPGEADYRRQLAQDPNDFAALTSLARLTCNPAHCAESIGYSRRALQIAPDDLELGLTLARSLALCQQFEEAIARCRQYLRAYPGTESAMSRLGETLLGARRDEEALSVFRQLLRASPGYPGVRLNLAQALARTGNYPEALMRYDEVFPDSPDNYDALQGKAFVLYWTKRFEEARAIFQSLAARQPNDPANAQALQNIARAEEEARWAALRPPADAPPQEFVSYFEKRLASTPDDKDALKGLAYAQAQLKNFAPAIAGYRRALELSPDDRDARMELARTLSLAGLYDDSVKLYQEILQKTPNDINALEKLARVYVWQAHPQEARPIFQGLVSRQPANSDYLLELARVETRLKDFPAARANLTKLLSLQPKNRAARAQLAQVELSQGQYSVALAQFNQVLKEDPNDFDALLGKARIAYYRGDLSSSHTVATQLVKEQPGNFDAVFLLANVDYARRNRKAALEMIQRAHQLVPHNPEVEELERRVREQPLWTLHTFASYAREIGAPTQFGNRRGLANEDLRIFGYGTTLGFFVLPRTDSLLSLNYLPSSSPSGLRGAAGPSEFLYRQTTRVTSRLTLRGGAGLARFGPGDLHSVPGQTEPINTATFRPLALAGFSYAPIKKFSFDLDATRSAINYTPTAVRFGVIEERLTGRLNFVFDPRTELHLEGFYARYSTERYDHVRIVSGRTRVLVNKADYDQGHGGSLIFNRSFFRSERLSLDGGYSGVAYGYAGRRRNIFMGFFNPNFYQRHQLTTRIYGNLRGAWGYEFSGGIGLQQVEQGQALTRAVVLSPTLTRKVNERLTLGLGYTHYNSAQTLGSLRGNALRFISDWKF